MFNQIFEKHRGGSVKTEPYQIDHVIFQASYIVIKLFQNGPVMKLRPSWKYHQGWKEDDSAGQ